jgi:hypothetical protein
MKVKAFAKRIALIALVTGIVGVAQVWAQQLLIPTDRMSFQIVSHRFVERVSNSERGWQVRDPGRILIVTLKAAKPAQKLDLFNVDFLCLYKAGHEYWGRSVGVVIRCIGRSPQSEETWSIPEAYGHEIGEWTDEEAVEYVEIGFLIPKDASRMVICVARSIGEISNNSLGLETPHQSSSNETADLVEKAKNSVVQVVAETDTGLQRGSGFIVTENGLVIASRHVVEGAKRIWVNMNGTDSLPAELVNGPKTDVDACLLRIRTERRFKPLPVAMNVEASNRIGQDVIVLGYPDGDPRLTVTRGLLAGFTRRNGVQCLKTTALVRKGNSGGPVLNTRGEVIGILWQSEDGGFNYAILTDEVQNLIEYARRQSNQTTPNQTTPNRFSTTVGFYAAKISR